LKYLNKINVNYEIHNKTSHLIYLVNKEV